MSDFSLFSLFTAGLACVVPIVSAYTKPVGDEPSGNPIYQPGLNSIVPAGENFTVTWDPTTPGTVTLVLLKGPSTNAVPQYAIAEKIKNSGTYVWAPSTDLAPQDTGYGLQLIVDATGQYQYTTQFGISNPDYKASSSSSSSSASATSTSSWSGHGGPGGYGGPGGHGSWSSDWASATGSWSSEWASATASASASASATSSANSTSVVNGTTSAHSTITGYAAPTGSAAINSTIVKPTGNITIPSSLLTQTATASAYSSSVSAATATGSSTEASAVPTNAAATMATSFAGLVVAAGVAVFAL